jgi:CO dehydrogenase maturation factor
MSQLIAISGKGGVGKTTVAGLIVRGLLERGCRPVLAIDADPNTCLDKVLGVRIGKTVGGVREEAREIAGKGMATGMAKQELLELKIEESLVEADGFDLIAMGRPEGPGCYCYTNNVLKATIGAIARHYPCVVLDNEAGLENLSRRIVMHVDSLVIVSDPSRSGFETVTRLHQLALEMEVTYDRLIIIVNRLRNDALPEAASSLKASTGADYVIGLPENRELAGFHESGESLNGLPKDNPVYLRLSELLGKLNYSNASIQKER